MSYELPVLSIISAGFIASYFLGGRRKSRLLMSYSRKIHEKMSGLSDVGFRPFGHAGLRIRCSMKDKINHYYVVEFAITMAARENLLYYPLMLIGGERDLLTAWCFLRARAKCSLEVVPVRDIRSTRKLEDSKYLHRVSANWETYRGFNIFTNDRMVAEKLLLESGVESCFARVGAPIKRFSIDQATSKIHLIANITIRNLEDVIQFVFEVGRVSSKLAY